MNCRRCGRELKKPESIAAGIGRACMKKLAGEKQVTLPLLDPKIEALWRRWEATAQEAVEHVVNSGRDCHQPVNIVGALAALGYLKEKEKSNEDSSYR